MKNFLKQLLTSTLAVIIGLVIVLIASIMMITSVVSDATEEEEVRVPNNAVLVVKLEGLLRERKTESPFADFQDAPAVKSLRTRIRAIEAAAKDDKIQGMFLDMGMGTGGAAAYKDLRKALQTFKDSGKWVIAHGEIMTEKNFYLASVADDIYLYPTGSVEWNGLVVTQYFLKRMFEKVGIQPQVFRVGKFKSFAEPFTRSGFSGPNRQQYEALLNELWGTMRDEIAAARDLSPAVLDSLAANLAVTMPGQALANGFIDGVKYEDELNQLLREKLELDEEAEINRIGVDKYAKTVKPDYSGEKLAVVYATGGIAMGESQQGETIGAESMVKTLRKLRKDDDVKAVVLRVNSPGGSALASDMIAREIALLKEEKPIIASMGDVAASGGYYISAPCDKILAQPNTITGSIGVIGLLFDARKMMNRELYLDFESVYSQNHKAADLGNPVKELTQLERRTIQQNIDSVYQDFLGVVREGRDFPSRDSVHQIAQGRVWPGRKAKDLGLVDELGGLEEAIARAAEEAGISEAYRVVDYPKRKSKFERLMEVFGDESKVKQALSRSAEAQLPASLREMKRLAELMNDPRGAYMLLPIPTAIN